MMQSLSIPRRGFRQIQVKISSPDDILNRSHGEVTKPETINYRFAKRFSVLFATGNAPAVSTSESVTKASCAIAAV
jgi:hypothetical protein